MGNGCAKRVSLYDNGTTASVAGDVRPGSHNAASISGDNSVHSGDSSIFRPRRQVCRSCQAQRLVKEGDVEGLLLVLSKEPSLLVCKLGCACTSLASRLRSALAVSHSLCTYICQEGERKLELLQAVGQLIRSGLSADTMQRLAGLNAPPLHHSNPNSARPVVAMTVHPEAHETTAGSASPPADAGDGSGAAVNRSSHARKAVLAMFLDRPDSRKHTGLILACVLRDPRVVSWLVSQGADIWPQDNLHACAAIHYAARHGFADCADALLESLPAHAWVQGHERYIEVRSKSGLTPLMYAALSGCPRTVASFLAHGASIYARTHMTAYGVRGSPPASSGVLLFAVLGWSLDCVKEILKAYVERGLPLGLFDPRYARDDNGHMPWQYAQTFHRPDIAEILNPSYDIMLLATGNGLELADWVSIPQLSSLAAGVLQAKLQGELLAAAEQQQRQQQQDLEEALQNGCCSSTRSSGEQQQSVAVEGSSHSRSTSSGSRSANALIATSVHGAQTGAHDAAAFLWGPGGRSRKSDMQRQAGMARLVLPQAPCQLSASVAPVHNSSLHACLRQFEPTDTGPKQQEEVSQLQQLQEHAQQQQNGQASDPGEVGPGVQARQATAVTQDSTKTPIKSLSRRSRSKLEHDEHGRIDGCCGVCWLEEAYVCMQPCQHVLCRTCAWRLSEMMLSRPLRCPFCRRETAGFVHAFTAEHEQA